MPVRAMTAGCNASVLDRTREYVCGTRRVGLRLTAMANLGASAGWGLVVGGSLLAGAVVAALLRLPASLAATVTAFGGGILLAAIALALVPDPAAGRRVTRRGHGRA